MMLLWPSLWTAVAQPDRVPQDVSSTCRNLTADTFEQRKAATGPDAAINDFYIYFFSNLIFEKKNKTKKKPWKFSRWSMTHRLIGSGHVWRGKRSDSLLNVRQDVKAERGLPAYNRRHSAGCVSFSVETNVARESPRAWVHLPLHSVRHFAMVRRWQSIKRQPHNKKAPHVTDKPVPLSPPPSPLLSRSVFLPPHPALCISWNDLYTHQGKKN